MNKTSKASKIKKQNMDDQDFMQSLLNDSRFDLPLNSKPINNITKNTDIDFEKDAPETIIKKLVLLTQQLRDELEEYKIYSDSTYCTSIEHNRHTSDVDNKLAELSQRIDNIEEYR